MFALGLPFLALLVASVESHLGVLGPKNVSQKDAEFERTYVDEVNSELVNIYTFNHTVTRNRTEGVRVSVNVLNKQKGAPLLFVVRQKEAVVSSGASPLARCGSCALPWVDVGWGGAALPICSCQGR